MGRRYVRDARGRFASSGYSGQTGGRGARLKAKTERAGGGTKIKAAGPAGTVGKPRGLKPQDSRKLRMGIAYSRQRAINQKIANRPDTAQVNIKGRFTGQAGKRYDAGLTRVVKAQKSKERAADKARNRQFKSDQSRAKKLRDVHMGSIAKAKGISKAQVESALKAQPASVQIKALKNWVKQNRTTAKPADKKPKAASKINDAKVSRVVGRVNSVVRGADSKSGVKRLNAVEVGQRAKSFLARKAGGVSAINGMGQAESFASVRKAMTKPPRYSTTKPNRNKPGAYNNLGQSSARAKARAAAMTPQQRMQQSNAAKAKPAPVASRPGRRGIGSRALQLPPPRVPGYVSGRRVAGTIAKRNATAKPAVSSTVARTRKQATAAQSYRRNEVLGRTRSRNARNAGLKRRDTGMRQLSLAGPSKKLYSYKPTQLRRK